MRKNYAIIGIIVCLIILGMPRISIAATFTVTNNIDAVDANPGDGICADSNGVCTLRAAVMEANALAGDDIISIVGGTFTLTLAGAGENSSETGDLDIQSNVTIKNDTGSNGDIVAIDGGGIDRVFSIGFANANVVLENLIIQNGKVDDNGGGIYLWGGANKLTLKKCTVTNNSANKGGGIHASVGNTVTIEDSQITENSTTGQFDTGGGISNGGAMTITGSLIASNSSSDIGGIRNGGQLTITNNSISGNNGLGIGNAGSGNWLKISNSVISENIGTATSQAGGIRNTNEAVATIVSSTISGNETNVTGYGSAIYNYNGTAKLFNSTVSNNKSKFASAALYNVSGTMSLSNSIIADNTDNCIGTVDSSGYNLIGWYSDNCSFQINTGDIIGTIADPADSKLGELADNGGETKTHALLKGSPAIGAGNPNGCVGADGTVLTTDQRGKKRDSKCDIGAFEEYMESVISSSAMVVDFGSVVIGESYPYELTAYNTGNGDLIISSSVLSDTTNFTMTGGGSNPCTGEPPTVAPDSSCTGLLTFKPTSADTFSATLTVASNDPNTPSLSIALSGVGVTKTEETTATPAQCGDGITQVGSEDCDDGNTADTDACLSTCKLAKCGDGYVEASVEECDGGDNCTAECKNKEAASAVSTTAVCGNGTVETDEECDDGNAVDTDTCSNACKTVTPSTTTGGEGDGSSSVAGGDGGGDTGTGAGEPASSGGCSLIR